MIEQNMILISCSTNIERQGGHTEPYNSVGFHRQVD